MDGRIAVAVQLEPQQVQTQENPGGFLFSKGSWPVQQLAAKVWSARDLENRARLIKWLET